MKKYNVKRKLTLLFAAIMCVCRLYSQNTGPNNIDHCGYIQLSAGDDVNLVTGDLIYSLPLFTIPAPNGGFPVSLTCRSGVTMDQEASWAGLGWSLTPGAITRTVNGFPDDWKNKRILNFLGGTNNTSYNVKIGYCTRGYASIGIQQLLGYNRNPFGFQSKTFQSFQRDALNISGTLYLNEAVSDEEIISDASGIEQSYNYAMDVYSLPYDCSKYTYNLDDDETVNTLMFPNYDEYRVNAQGLSGAITPRIFENAMLAGQGRQLSPTADKSVTYYTSYDMLAEKNVYFSFDNEHSSYIRVKDNRFSYDASKKDNYISEDEAITEIPESRRSMYNATGNSEPNLRRKGSARHIEYFTNYDIVYNQADVKERGFIETGSIAGSRDANNWRYFDEDGIGAFTITSDDGTSYHFSLPVYQFEQFYKDFMPSDGNCFYQVKQDKYAYTWLLTAITGPDYCDDGDHQPDAGDYGFWIKFNYGKWTDGYIWRTPYSGEDQYDNDAHSSFHWGRKQVYYLNSIQTATHTAYFIKDLRNDAFGKPLSSNEIYETADISQLIIDELGWFHDGIPFLGTIYNYKKQVSLSLNSAVAHKILKLSKIILVRNQDNIILNSASGADLITQQTGNIEIEEKIIAGSDIYSRNIYSESFEMYYSDNILDNNDLSYFNSNNSFTAEEKALRIVEFVHDYSLCLGAPNTSSTTTGRLTLKEVNLLGAGSVQNVPSYRFTYHNSQNFDISKMNKWGYHQDVPYLWNLAQIEAPTGGITIIEYEDDDFVFEAAAYHLDCANTNAQCFGTAAGVRVKKISRQDESGNLYSTLYEYKMHGQNIYSGVISFEPREYFDVIFRTFIPYIYDLPMPRVMYELVKVRKTAANDDSDYETETEYYFEVLQRTENSEKPADDGKHFEMGKQFEVINTQRNLDVDNDGADDASTELIPYDDSDIELKVRGAVIYDNTAVLGRPLFVVTRNKTGDIIGRTGYYYYNRDSLSGGVTQETFNYRKICKANIDADTDIETVKYLNYSSRIKYPSVLEKIVTSENGITSVDTYDKFDLFTGIPVETSSNGVLQKIIPAYKIQEFEEMGSKLSDITNRNMLSQLAARYTMNSDSATTYAGIYTWKKSWGARLPSNGVTAGQLYEEIPPQALPDIWRKHSEFTWDGERNDNGSFKGFCVKDIDGTMLVNKDFIWDATDDVNISNGWIKTLENKRFDKYSHLLETVDASDKHTSFKMDINNVNLAAEAVNANYRSFAAAGFEYYSTISNPLTPLFVVKDYGCEIFDNQNNSWLSSGDDGIIAHSGNHFIRINGGIGPMFYTTIDDKDNNEIRIAPGKYRASVWVHKNSDNGIRLDFSINNICASDIIFNSSDPNRIQIDDWILLNLDFEVPICETGDRIMVYITYYQRDGTLLNGDYSYIDDFRIHPVDASLISYIYDNKGNVSAKLNPVNFAAFFEYDEEFRLKNVIKETIKYGKQKVSDYEYHYAREGSQ